MLNKTKSEPVAVESDKEVIGFQSALEDVAAVIRKLGPHCRDLSELADMCESAVHSAATARLLMKIVAEKSP